MSAADPSKSLNRLLRIPDWIFLILGAAVVISIGVLAGFGPPAAQEQLLIVLDVGENVGFNLDSNALYLGQIPPGASVWREIEIENPLDSRARIILTLHGPLSEWIELSDSQRILLTGQKVRIRITATVPSDATPAHLESELIIRIYAH